jgi:hypothetical protein
LLAAAFIAGAVLSHLAAPVYRQIVMSIAYEPYARLVFACDNAMRDHLLMKQRLARDPASDNVSALEAAEIALLDCQDYDQMRKRLIQWGLRDNELALMGLRAIEEKGDSLHRVIEIHEIRY